ncbi:MAG TPA: hypothetical protein VMS00_15660 [Acidimicrobiales bacterium]|nr:hypothetical protein [Acidimicrobiales bacterium]
MPNEDEIIESHLDQVMEQLIELHATDPSINLVCNQATLGVLIEVGNPIDATLLASGYLRTAIHAANGSTPDWPDPQNKAWSVKVLSLSAEPVAETEEAEVGELVGAA